MLAAPGHLGRVECRENALRSVQSGYQIGYRGADLIGRSVGRAGYILDAGFALHDDIVAGAVFLQTGIAESGNRAIHQGWAPSAYGGVTEAKTIHRARPKIFNQDVRSIDQPPQHLTA